MNLNCPVCNQSGLPDYRTQNTTCPQCDSDLRPYLLLNSISGRKGKKSKTIFGLLLLTVCSLLIVFILLKFRTEKNELIVSINDYKDSIIGYKKTIVLLKTSILEKSGYAQTFVTYNVKKGDCLWKIADFFYNDGRMYTLIEKDNNLVAPYTLKSGQHLIINLNRH